MWYPYVEASINAYNELTARLASLGYTLNHGRSGSFGDTGITYDIEGIGVIGISALDPSSELFDVLAVYEREMEHWHRGDTYRSTRFRSVLVGKRPSPYPPTEPQDEEFLADLYMNPHAIGQLRGVGSYCSLSFV